MDFGAGQYNWYWITIVSFLFEKAVQQWDNEVNIF